MIVWFIIAINAVFAALPPYDAMNVLNGVAAGMLLGTTLAFRETR